MPETAFQDQVRAGEQIAVHPRGTGSGSLTDIALASHKLKGWTDLVNLWRHLWATTMGSLRPPTFQNNTKCGVVQTTTTYSMFGGYWRASFLRHGLPE